LSLCSIRFHVRNAKDHALAEDAGCASDRIERHGNISRIEQTIELRSAGAKLLRHRLFRFLLLPHGLLQLPRQQPLDGDRLGADFLPSIPEKIKSPASLKAATDRAIAAAIFPSAGFSTSSRPWARTWK
jgi:hypothetical protein